jgi:hypothetical protein
VEQTFDPLPADDPAARSFAKIVPTLDANEAPERAGPR